MCKHHRAYDLITKTGHYLLQLKRRYWSRLNFDLARILQLLLSFGHDTMVRFSYALVQLQQAYDEFEDNHMKVKFEHIVKYIKHIVRAAD